VERALEAAPDLIPAQLALERLSAKGQPERQLAIARGAALTDPERAPTFASSPRGCSAACSAVRMRRSPS